MRCLGKDLCDARPEALFVKYPHHVFGEASRSLRFQCDAGKKGRKNDVNGSQITPPDAKPGVRYFVVRRGQARIYCALYAVTLPVQTSEIGVLTSVSLTYQSKLMRLVIASLGCPIG